LFLRFISTDFLHHFFEDFFTNFLPNEIFDEFNKLKKKDLTNLWQFFLTICLMNFLTIFFEEIFDFSEDFGVPCFCRNVMVIFLQLIM
jgi:hypothetical protein